MSDRQELEELRRLEALESRSSVTPPPSKPTIQQLYEQQVKQNGWGTGIPKAANQFGGAVTDLAAKVLPPEIAAGAGYAANVAAQLPTTLFGFRGTPVESSATAPMAKWLMNKAVKPATEDVVNKSADAAFGTMLRERQLPTQGGMVKAQQIVSDLHPQVKAGIAQSASPVAVAPVEEKFLEQYNKALPQGESAVKEVSDVWKNFSQNHLVAGSDSMTAQMADVMKRGLQKNARANYGKPTGDAAKALAAYLREGMVDSVSPRTQALLAREAANMNVLDVARNSIAQGTKANPAGLAALRADDAIPMLGFLADRSPLIKGLLAHMIYQGGRPEVALPAAAAASRVPELFKQE